MNSITEKAIDSNVELRLRFQLDTEFSAEEVIHRLKNSIEGSSFQLKVSDEYVWLSFKKKYQKIYTPQLQLRIENEEGSQHNQIHFLFGPDSGLWTMFMFLHFGLAVCFIGFSIWLYTNISLQKPYGFILALLGLIAVVWISLYVWARQNRKKGKPQAKQLEAFVTNALQLK